ncbi:DUF3427 domain-containing protein [Lentisalinibacter orientalis]|uniref:DUF3427 domain-containing protein n=1 Tax=Lentisalinibacter orientalis TaxID=2992241 RepID=UPI00386CEC37
MAFITESGLTQLEPHLLDLLDRRGAIRLLTGDYLDVTEPNALLRVIDWLEQYPAQVRAKIFRTNAELGFHPKAYLIGRDYQGVTAYIGSSNLTRHALLGGIEWNQRLVGQSRGTFIRSVTQEFERLFQHPNSEWLTVRWIESYEARRKVQKLPAVTGVHPDDESPPEVPTPHGIQAEALDALQETREEGNEAGLVVMATGLGKTWLAAFDSEEYDRVLFVAHREEILRQALNTFRRIRPNAKLGLYMGQERERDADVLFASIQTLSKVNHLRRFGPSHFDYVVIDEFHHAAASTYRRLIDYFEPRFLLGLTATPERTDGGDLLALCGENLVFRCDLSDGIGRKLLSPFHYYGVPDEIDFSNIPWRSGRFDPELLEHAVATEKRARNAFEQWKKCAQSRTLAFCVSRKHADFMKAFFEERGVAVAAVHSGPSSDPRTQSLKALQDGRLRVVFAVDMFNEGVDVPSVDTVMMLRPTESKIIWLQQFGRGLRMSEGKQQLNVIDYIGNHRSFLQVPALLLPGADSSIGGIQRALMKLKAGELELPEGCAIEYELEALDILEKLAKPSGITNQTAAWYRSFRELQGERPTATEAHHEGYDPKTVRTGFGSWFGFVKAEGDLGQDEAEAFERFQAFFEALETTPMTKSFKMVLLLAMIAAEKFPGSIPIEHLVVEVQQIARRIRTLKEEFGAALGDVHEMRVLLEKNPMKAWSEGQGTAGKSYFSYEDEEFRSFAAPESLQSAIRHLTREICDWRLAQYLDRSQGESGLSPSIVCRVSHSGGKPILFLPKRDRNPGIPTGWVPIIVNGEPHQANFQKVAVNVVVREGETENGLPWVLRSMFGDDAGTPGKADSAKFVLENDIYHLRPIGVAAGGAAELWGHYMREEIPPLWGKEFSPSKWNQGFISDGNDIFLLVSLDKGGLASEHQYEDKFLSPSLFQWVSQNRTKRSSPTGKRIAEHGDRGIDVHLFVRDKRKTPKGTAAPFVYCGEVAFVDWDGDQPITVRWQLPEAVPAGLKDRFGLLG